MVVNASDRIIVRRYNLSGASLAAFEFDQSTGLIEQVDCEGSRSCGWLIDFERVLSGPRRVLFYEAGHRKFVALGDRVFALDVVRVKHRKGCLSSSLEVLSPDGGGGQVRYLTPWWRLLWDDGSHPDLQFPLEYLANRWS